MPEMFQVLWDIYYLKKIRRHDLELCFSDWCWLIIKIIGVGSPIYHILLSGFSKAAHLPELGFEGLCSGPLCSLPLRALSATTPVLPDHRKNQLGRRLTSLMKLEEASG